LVTHVQKRSKGVGGVLCDSLVDYAQAHDCASVHLDSGVQRAEARRVTFRKRMVIGAFYFVMPLATDLPVTDVMETS